jgi:predicted nucleotidyltransferase
VLSEKQAEVARVFLAAREVDRKHLVIYLSGAHAYGFPSPDSDLDLKCIHIAPTADLVGLTGAADDPPDRIEIVEGVELDYGSNELAPALRGAIKGNGNFLERFLGELVFGGDTALLAEAREVVRPIVSRRVAHHYRGFATSQLKAFDDKPTAKRALYVLRTAATGRHILAHGTMETDVARLGDFVPREIDELLAIKRSGERSELAADHARAWRGHLVDAIAAVDTAARASSLPYAPPESAVAGVDAWLRTVRRRFWD